MMTLRLHHRLAHAKEEGQSQPKIDASLQRFQHGDQGKSSQRIIQVNFTNIDHLEQLQTKLLDLTGERGRERILSDQKKI